MTAVCCACANDIAGVDLETLPTPLLTVVFHKDGRELRFFSTIATFGTPRDVTLDELRIECAFPADDVTAEFCKELAQEGTAAHVPQ